MKKKDVKIIWDENKRSATLVMPEDEIPIVLASEAYGSDEGIGKATLKMKNKKLTADLDLNEDSKLPKNFEAGIRFGVKTYDPDHETVALEIVPDRVIIVAKKKK